MSPVLVPSYTNLGLGLTTFNAKTPGELLRDGDDVLDSQRDVITTIDGEKVKRMEVLSRKGQPRCEYATD